MIDSPTPSRCRSSALFAALAAVLAACGGDAPSHPDSGGGTAPDAAPAPDAAEPDGSVPDAAPSPDAAPGTRVTAIGVGNNVTCAVLSTGTVRCWGANEQGQLGGGEVTDPQPSPVNVVGISDAVAVDCGTATCCARTQSGRAQCWGWNDQGALGAYADPPTLPNRPMAGAVMRDAKGPVELENVTALGVGGLHSCAISSGSVYCWGWNQAGQGGQTPGEPLGLFRATETTVVTQATHIAAAKCFFAEHTCAVVGGVASCWGLDFEGQLGDGEAGGFRGTAAPVPGLSGVTAIAAGQKHTCAIADAGKGEPEVFCWGLTNFGQAGIEPPGGKGPPPPIQLTPNQVPDLEDPVAVAAGQSHTCALLADGTARCWGAKNLGQLGDGTIAEGVHADPVTVIDPNSKGQPLQDIVGISAGFFHTCAVTANGRAYCWGANDIGQLGQGKIGGAPVPAPIEVPVVVSE